MRLRRSALVVIVVLSALLLRTEKLLASPGPVPPGACLYALDATASAAFQIAGAQSTYTACGVVVESTSSSGFEMEGAGTLYLENHAQVSVVGGADLTGQTELWDTISNEQVQAVQTTSPGDPLASLTAPSTGTIVGKTPTYFDMNSKPANNTIAPGIYCGGLEIGNTNGTKFTFSPGIYILAGGGLTLESQAQVTGTGVTFYNTSSAGWGCASSYNYTPVTISGQVTASLSAPTSGSFDGILFFGNRTGCSTKGSCTDQINGGSTAILNGALYFASDEIMITGSNASGYMMLVADKIYINGNSNFGNNGNPFDGITVSVSPTTATLAASQTQQFTATVANTANTAVTWTISPSVGSISSSGLYTAPSSITVQQTVTVTATSQTDTSKSGTATITLTPPVAPTITFTVANQTYGVAPFTVAATSNSSGAIAYSVVSGPAAISGSTVTITGVGTVVLQALQAPSGNYTAGTQNASFTVSAKAPTITFTVANQTYGVAPFGVSASSNSSGAIAYSVVSGPAAISGSTVTITGVGTVVLQASQAASGNYTAGTQNTSFTVAAEAPTITFSIANQTYGEIPFTVSASSNSSGAITYSVVSGPATISGSMITVTGVGTVVVQASQTASGDFTAGTNTASFTVLAEAPAITFTVANQTYGGAPFAVLASSNSSGTFTYSVVSGPATISGSTVTITGVGTVVLLASQTASGNYSAGTQNATFTVSAEAPTITFTLSNQTYGVAPFAVTASSNSPGAITYSVVSGPATISGSTVTITGVGTVVLQASQAAGGNYAIGTQNASFTVSAEAPMITFSTPNQIYGVAPFVVSATSNSSGAITYSVVSGPATISGSTVTITGVGTVVLQVSQAASGNYAAGLQTASFTVSAEAPTITFTLSNQTYGVAPFAVTAISNSPGAITYSVVSGPATITGSTVTITGVGTVILQASQAASGNYTAGRQNASFTVSNPPVSITVSPSTATVNANQTVQLTATVSNTINTAVTWTISPTGAGSISAAGIYTAPASIVSLQTVIATATSQADTTQSASASITLSPTPCLSNGYTYQRVITIDHTKVPNTDQLNFPFLFNTTDPLLATTANGGHVSSSSGYDIIFTSDPAGQNILSYEMEEYNPQTGQVIAWVRIPDLSQSTDTSIYLFYGNAAVTTSQQNAVGVWDSNYVGVWHLANSGSQLSLTDSTSNGNNATNNGAVATAGQIDGGMQTDGSTYATIGAPASLANLAEGNATFSAWVNSAAGSGGRIMGKDDGNGSEGWSLGLNGSNDVDFVVVYSGSDFRLVSSTPATNGAWSFVTVTLAGNATQSAQATVYVNGVPSGSGSGGSGYTGDDSGQTAYLANATYGDEEPSPLNGSADEIRISNVIRSADWIATEYNNQGSPSTFYALGSESDTVNPAAVVLYASQAQQFTVLAQAGCGTVNVAWTIAPAGVGSITSSGLYTAPASISAQQTVVVSATSQQGGSQIDQATITLLPPVGVTVTPATITISDPGQPEQFTANVINASNTAVMWTLSPAGVGTLSTSGLYTAPASFTSSQTVTITATSQADPTKSASATITLLPEQPTSTKCGISGYTFPRAIVIHHQQVPNTDQTDFPFLFSVTDPAFATVDNGGHVSSFYGYDIFFSSDPTGQTRLDYEMEQYNPVTGQVIAWIRIPTLSHGADTTIYVFYGNPNVTTPQQNPTGVWDSSYQAVYHLANAGTGIATDSTTNGYNGTPTSILAAPGEIDGAASFNGISSYLQIPSADFASYPTAGVNTTGDSASFGAWFQTASSGVILGQTDGTEPGGSPNGSVPPLYIDNNGLLRSSFFWHGNTGDQIVAAKPVADNNWHYAVDTYSNGTETLYIDGQNAGSQQVVESGYSASYAYFLGAGETNTWPGVNGSWLYLKGNLDEVTVSNIARSSDWIQTEYNNQSSPSTFYSLSPQGDYIAPASVSLTASESEQFTVSSLSICASPALTWSIRPAGAGTISASGLYTAPATIDTEQAVTVTATNLAAGTVVGWATVTLVPPASVSVTPPSVVLYSGQTQQFTAVVSNSADNSVTWTLSPLGVGSITSNGLYTAPNVNFSGSAFSASSLSLNGSAVVTSGGNLQLTDGGTYEAGTAWYPSALPIQSFVTDFSFQLIPSTYFVDADGITFTIQGLGTGELGSYGGCLGYCGISKSVAIKFDTFNNAGEGINSTGLFTDGAEPFVPAIDLTPTGVNLHSSDLIDAHMVYDGTNLTMTLTDTVTNGTATEVFPVDIPGIVGGNTAYVGFTGATGAGTSTQDILSWTFVSLSEQTVAVTATSVEDTTKSGNAQITLMPSAEVSATPGNVVLYGGQTQQFTANVTNASSNAVTWAISPASGAGTISPLGLFIAPTTVMMQQTVTITATSVAVPTAFARMTVTLVPQVSLSLAPSSATLYSGQSQQFTANLTVGGVTWTILPATGTIVPPGMGTGTINSAGLYTALASITAQSTIIVTATSTANSTVFALATVTLMPGSSGSTGGGTIDIGISGFSAVALPNTLALTGTVTDSAGLTPTITWSQVGGPGTVTFSAPQQVATTASFSEAGYYVLELSASDSSGNSGAVRWPVVVSLEATNQGWIGSPISGSMVSGVVPITVAQGITLQSGVLTYYPANNPNNVVTLNGNTTGSGQIGTFDATMLPNGSYWIELVATTTSGNTENNLILVTVGGNYKPGRVTATVTDLVVPSTGLAINIQRTYDSLNAAVSGDFGYGWNLGINVNLTVGPDGSVTFTLGGQRRTFYLTPEPNGFLPYYDVAFTPEPGFFGTLTDSAPGCADYFDFVIPDGSLWFCVDGGEYNPPGYTYTDPNGTSYTISAAGNLQSIVDRSGNGLTITANGITSTTGLNVPFVRDSLNRITQITDPVGNIYSYTYDASGQLTSVTYPNTPQPSTYTYTPTGHYYVSGTDFRNNPLPVTTYYTSTDFDTNGLPLNGRLASVQDALGETTSYAYNLATNTTTITYPPDANNNTGTGVMVYDSYGMLLSSTDPLGNTTTNVYDSNHNLISVTDPLGNVNTYTYDANGNKTSSIYPATPSSSNTTSTTQYNQYSEPTSTIDELGNVRVFNYDANFNPQSVTDGIGTLASFQFNANQTFAAGAIGFDITVNSANASQFTYDGNGNLIGRTDALGRTTSYTYDSLGQKLSMTTPTPTAPTGGSASTTNYTYDQLGNLLLTAAPLSRTTSSTYDGNGNKITDTDARGNVTGYQYDSLNRLIETDYPDGTKATKTYDFRNNVIRETDQNGNVTLHAYDLSGRQVSVTRGYGTASASATTYAYDNAGRKTSETDALGHASAYTYDADSRLTAIAGVKGNFTYAYDNAGNRIAQTDGNNHTTKFQYDARKRLTVTTYADGTTTTNTYDGPGNLASVTDQAGNVVQYTYDAANQLKTVVQTASPNTSNNANFYGYDPLGNLTGLTDENLHTTQNSFDLFNEPVSKTLPDQTLTETRNYDPAGNLISLVHFNGVTTTYTYDALNRLLSRATPGETTVSFTYTATGKRHTMSDASGTTSYYYDSIDRLTTKATPEGTLNYSYDAAGNLASTTSNHVKGVSAMYSYDSLNRLNTVADANLAGGAKTTSYVYDPASNVATVNYANGVQSVMTYDALNRITGLATQNSGYLYQRGPTGNLSYATELNGRTLNWTYDGIYRLTNESISSDPSNNSGTASYTLDPVGNRLAESTTLPGLSSGSFGYNTDDEVNTETYDANGNTLATGGEIFTYDSDNHLMTMNGGAVTIVYDGDGNRVAKTVGGVTTQYLVDDMNPTGYAQVVEELVSGAVTREYTYGLQRISQNQLSSNTWTVSFYGYDGGGNVRNLTNTTGAITDEYEYDAFGNLLNPASNGTPNEMLYRGEQYDSDLNLYYLRARYYNPATGRFLSRDPEDGKAIDPKTLHKYLYASGDPVNRIDPRGRDDLFEYEGDEKISAEIEAIEPEVREEAYAGCMEAVLELLGFNYGINVSSVLPFAYDIAKGICGVWASGML